MIEHIDTLLSNALRQHLSGDLSTAENLYREIISKSPNNAKAKHFLGFLLQQTNHLTEAFDHLSAAIALDNRHAEWHFNLGVLLARQGNTSGAIDAFSNAIAIDSRQYFYWTNLGAAFESNGQLEKAEDCYKTAIEINSDNSDAFHLLSALCSKLERYEEARHFNYRGVIKAPAESISKIVLGQAYYELGYVHEAIRIFEEHRKGDPGNSIVSHLLALCYQKKIPEQCTSGFVEQTFDIAANNFEETLKALGYSGPELTHDFLSSSDYKFQSLNILDLGCGTGMVGTMLKPYANVLTGVDLSQAMLDIAKAKDIYDKLYKNDIVEFLESTPTHYDLVSCMDTFVYIGNLEKLISEIYSHLTVGGTMIVSTEKTESNENYQLNISGRYSHNENYLKKLLNIHNLKILSMRDITIRMEAGYPLAGQFICAARVI